ncbi:MAG: RNA polymerase sigma-70 factor [Prolixibacteraceae bacterium]|jgi:RNA polymerase sigma-70 factor (ECF subfamily)|nr:RNA polymerase sigma-70 factor [Prolixibacteraceae bacterium]
MEKDKQYFSAIKKGDKKSFELLFNAYYNSLCYYALKFLDDYDDAEEVVQDVFITIWEKRSTTVLPLSVRNYLFGSVRNRSLNVLKHKKIVDRHKSDNLKAQLEQSDDELYREIDLMNKINAHIDALPPRRREIFILSREYGLKYREIAEKLNLSVKTVEAQMGVALKSLRENLKEYKTLIIGLIFFFRNGKGKTAFGCRN